MMNSCENEMMPELHIAVIKFIDRTGLANAIYSRVLIDKRSVNVIDIPVQINLGEILESNNLLAEMILKSPGTMRIIFRNVIFVLVKFFNIDSSRMDHLMIKSCVEDILSNVELETLPTETTKKHFKEMILNFQSEKVSLRRGLREVPRLSSQFFSEDSSFLKEEGLPDFQLLPQFEWDFNDNMQHCHSNITSPSQILVKFQIDGLPFADPYLLHSMSDCPLNLEEPQIFLVSGIVLSLSSPIQYTVWSQFRCTSEKCKRVQERNPSKPFLKGDEATDLCRFCSSELVEDPSSREVGRKFSLMVLPHDEYLHQEFYLKHSLLLSVKDMNVKCVEPGQRIDASVLVTARSKGQHPTLEIVKIYSEMTSRTLALLPSVFRKLLVDRKDSPWSFVLTLAYIFCSTVSPSGTFHKLKIALLLSLASCSPNESGLAVLAVGRNETLHSRLFKCASLCAPRAVWHSSLNSLCGTIRKDAVGETWVEAGSLLWARGGVTVIGDLATTKKDVKDAVFEALESKHVRVDFPNRSCFSSNAVSYSLCTSIWSSYNPSYSRKQGTLVNEDDLFLHVCVGELTKSLTDVFGLVVYSEHSSSDLHESSEVKMSLQILSDCVHGGGRQQSASLISTEDLIQFFKFIRGINLTFTAEAENILKGYYVVSRRLRGDCIKGSGMPVTAISTLTEVAKSHARLSLRTQVEVWDAVAAVMLYEETLASCSGFSPLNVSPSPHLATNADLHHLLGRNNDRKMFLFTKQLQDLISEHYGN